MVTTSMRRLLRFVCEVDGFAGPANFLSGAALDRACRPPMPLVFSHCGQRFRRPLRPYQAILDDLCVRPPVSATALGNGVGQWRWAMALGNGVGQWRWTIAPGKCQAIASVSHHGFEFALDFIES